MSSTESTASPKTPSRGRGRVKEHVLGEPIPGRYPWSKTYVCSCGARLLSPEVAQIHIKNFNKDKTSEGS